MAMTQAKAKKIFLLREKGHEFYEIAEKIKMSQPRVEAGYSIGEKLVMRGTARDQKRGFSLNSVPGEPNKLALVIFRRSRLTFLLTGYL